ncbi:hypothetical protein ABFX02_08G090600 [Erythranthe guttata]
MEKEEEIRIQFLGFYGIFRESFTIAFFCRNKLFGQITIATIFPLSLIFLLRAQFFEFMETLISSEKIGFSLIKIAYFIFFIALSMLSTCVVVYAVACSYTKKADITFVEVISVVPKVWKRVTVTLIWSFIVVLVYNMIAFSILLPWLASLNPSMTKPVVLGTVFAIYMMGFVYISIVCHLASVVSVLEEDCGIEAMIKGKALVKGKTVISFTVFFFMSSCFVLIEMVFQRFVVHGESFWSEIGYGIICFFLLSGFTLLGLVVQTLVYMVCKLNHREIIDESCLLANHLEVYLGDYVSLRSKDVQLEQVYVIN